MCNRFELLFCFAVITIGFAARNDDNKKRKINEYYRAHDTFNIDDESENIAWGSGYNNDGYDYSGGGAYGVDDEDFMESSGDGPTPSPCQKLLDEMIGKALTGAYRPRCTDQGEFDSMQCWGSTGECWCVDSTGAEIANTRVRSSHRLECDSHVKKDQILAAREPELEYNSNVNRNIEYPEKPVDSPYETGPITIQTTEKPADPNDGMQQQGTLVHTAYRSLTAKPGILAGVIGGAVVGLLCAVLLVMFIVYRMRKKDEGSYSLDAPKRSPSLHTYSRASNREFYA